MNKIKENGFIAEINKIDNSLVRLIKKRREKIQITNIKFEKRNIITDPTNIKMIYGDTTNTFMYCTIFSSCNSDMRARSNSWE